MTNFHKKLGSGSAKWIPLLFYVTLCFCSWLWALSLTFLVAEKCHNTVGVQEANSSSESGELSLGIFGLRQPVGTFCQWREKPFLKHSGPHQPTRLKHPFRNNSNHSIRYFLLCLVHKKTTKTNVDLIHYDFIVTWNYLCSYAWSPLLHKQIHMLTHLFTYTPTSYQTPRNTHTNTCCFQHTKLWKWLIFKKLKCV